MVIDSMWRERRVDGRLRFVGYLLCVIIVLEAATVEQTSAAESVAADGAELNAAAERRVRRHAYSVTNDLMTLTNMLRDESQRRRMQSAEAFFNSLHKRYQYQLPKQSSQNDETLSYRPSRWN